MEKKDTDTEYKVSFNRLLTEQLQVMYLDDTVDISVDVLAFQVFRGNCSFTQMLELQSRNNISLFFFFM